MSDDVNSPAVVVQADSRVQAGELDWGKGDGLLPAVVQDADTLRVLMHK